MKGGYIQGVNFFSQKLNLISLEKCFSNNIPPLVEYLEWDKRKNRKSYFKTIMYQQWGQRPPCLYLQMRLHCSSFSCYTWDISHWLWFKEHTVLLHVSVTLTHQFLCLPFLCLPGWHIFNKGQSSPFTLNFPRALEHLITPSLIYFSHYTVMFCLMCPSPSVRWLVATSRSFLLPITRCTW